MLFKLVVYSVLTFGHCLANPINTFLANEVIRRLSVLKRNFSHIQFSTQAAVAAGTGIRGIKPSLHQAGKCRDGKFPVI